jgi:phosphatidylglycerophosphate synthase
MRAPLGDGETKHRGPSAAHSHVSTSPRRSTVWWVQSVSFSRLLAALVFASLALQEIPVAILAGIYGFAMASDLVDGFLARRLRTGTYAGKVIDLVGDKSLTIVSLLYAAERGMDLLPLAIIASREVIMIGFRSIVVDNVQLLPTSRLFGGLMAMILWSNTLFLVFQVGRTTWLATVNRTYWVCAIVLLANLLMRISTSRRRIIASVTMGE